MAGAARGPVRRAANGQYPGVESVLLFKGEARSTKPAHFGDSANRQPSCRRGFGTRNLCCGLSEPGFETGLAELCVIARNQSFLADSRSRVTRLRVSDDLAGIIDGGQSPPD